MITPYVGGAYNWKGQPERLVYMGTMTYNGDRRTWHQFAKVEEPHEVWCEVLPQDLEGFEETEQEMVLVSGRAGESLRRQFLAKALEEQEADPEGAAKKFKAARAALQKAATKVVKYKSKASQEIQEWNAKVEEKNALRRNRNHRGT
jgi:hypothetical protein